MSDTYFINKLVGGDGGGGKRSNFVPFNQTCFSSIMARGRTRSSAWKTQSCSTPCQPGWCVCVCVPLIPGQRSPRLLFLEQQDTNISFIHYSLGGRGSRDLHLCQINHLTNKHIKARHAECRMAAHYAEWADSPCSHTYQDNSSCG